MTELFLVDCSELTLYQIEKFLPHINPEKAERIKQMKLKGKQESMAGELLLRYAVNKIFNIPIADIKTALDKNGKPYLLSYPDIYFNISHSSGLCIVAVSDCEVGVDIQCMKDINHKSLAKRVFTEKEYKEYERLGGNKEAFYRIWCLKEAVYKLYGDGLSGLSGDLKPHKIYFDSVYKNCHVCVVTKS